MVGTMMVDTMAPTMVGQKSATPIPYPLYRRTPRRRAALGI